MKRFETTKDREEELRMGQAYCECFPEHFVKQQDFYSAYDFKRFDARTGIQNGWLEVKMKSDFFDQWEVFPMPKVNFTRHTPLPCYFLVERTNRAKLFDMTDIVRKLDSGHRAVITKEMRRKDRDEQDQIWTVIMFPSEWGKDIYYL